MSYNLCGAIHLAELARDHVLKSFGSHLGLRSCTEPAVWSHHAVHSRSSSMGLAHESFIVHGPHARAATRACRNLFKAS
eukprot:7397139-Pyramimonas_sp.AAC.1